MFALLKVKNHASVSQQIVFWNNQTFFYLFRSVKLVMTIVTDLAIVIIVNVMTIQIVMHFSKIKLSIKYKGLVLRKII